MKPLTATCALPLIVLLLAACAAEPTAPSKNAAAATQAVAAPAATASGEKDDMVCTREYPTGSNIPITKCRSRQQIEAEKAAAMESLRRNQTGGPNTKMGGG